MAKTFVLSLRKKIVCPHCWHEFQPEDILAVAGSPNLFYEDGRTFGTSNDSKLRFLPLRFNIHGTPIDSEGFECQYKACPRCLLKIPDILLSAKTSYVSIVGAPSSGKSYFLTSMTYKMRSTFPNYFKYSFIDADPLMNERLREYESHQFESENVEAYTAIEKTQVTGSTYSSTMINGQMFQFPQPYIFTMRPLSEHPQYENGNLIPNAICFYDNAGESYLSGQDSETSPVTRHLQNSDAILFLFDPMQDVRFRQACRSISDDPQLQVENLRSNVRQDEVFNEMVRRCRFLRHMGPTEIADIPLIIVVTKFDIWAPLLNISDIEIPWQNLEGKELAGLDLVKIRQISNRVRDLLLKLIPHFPMAAGEFSRNVTFVPTSATGCSPTKRGEQLVFRPRDLAPIWAEVPLLLALQSVGLVQKLETSN